MIKYLLSCFLGVICYGFVQAQLYEELSANTELTFEEIVAQTELSFDTIGREQHSGYKQFERWKYWTKRSLDENGKIISSAAAFKNVNQFKQNEGSKKMMTVNWSELGPESATNTSTWSSHIGRITSIGLDVNNANHYIVGGQTGGVWKTTDNAVTWSPMFDSQAQLSVYALEISHANNQHYFCGTSGLGIMKSVNGGTTWTSTTGIPTNARIIRIIMHPSNANILLAVNEWGEIYRTTNAGSNWTKELDISDNLYDLEFHPSNSSIVYASGEGVVYKSTDSGVTYTTLSGPWGSGAMMMAVTEDDSDYLYVLEEDSGGFEGLYLSTDSGATFSTQMSSNGTNNIMGYNLNQSGGQAPRDMDVVVNPNDKTEVHVAGVMTFKSTNSGSTFTQTTHWVIANSLPFIHADCDLMIYQDDQIFFGTDGGLFISTDGGTTFDDKTTGLGVRQFYRIGVSKTEVDRVSGGSQDNGTGVLKNGTWYDYVGADGMETFIDKDNKDILYATIQYGNLYKSTNGGSTLVSINNTSGSGAWVTPLEQDPSSANTFYQGKSEVYKTTNGGNSWSTLSSFTNTGKLQELSIAPSNNNVMLAAFDDEVWRTTDGGTVWTDVTPNFGFSNVNYISFHPTDDQKILMAMSGTSNKVIESTDQGSTWTNITGNLPAIGSECAIYEGGTSDGIYVGMNPGVYYKTTGNWESYMTALPNVRMAELEIAHGFVYGASYGRGLWKVDPANTNLCSLDGANVAIELCEGYGTTTTDDDIFTFSVNPVGNNLGTTYTVSGDVSASAITYGAAYTFDNGGAGYAYTSGGLTLTITDDDDSGCNLSNIAVTAPGNCSVNYFCVDASSILGPGVYTAIGPKKFKGGSQSNRNANWFIYTPSQSGFLTVESCERGIDTRLYIHSGTCTSLNLLASSDNDCPITTGSNSTLASEVVDLCVTAGTTYFIEWDDRWSSDGFDFDVAFYTNTFYEDADGDGYGAIGTTAFGCNAPSGFVTNNTDCDDTDANNYPSNTEVCDGQDNNCDTIVDEGCSGLEPCDDIYLVINPLVQDTNRAEINIISDANLSSAQPILYAAGVDIDLDPNFEVALGTEFEANIQPCFSPPVPITSGPFLNLKSLEELKNFVNKYNSSLEGMIIKSKASEKLFASKSIEEISEWLLNQESGYFILDLKLGNQIIKQQILIGQ